MPHSPAVERIMESRKSNWVWTFLFHIFHGVWWPPAQFSGLVFSNLWRKMIHREDISQWHSKSNWTNFHCVRIMYLGNPTFLSWCFVRMGQFALVARKAIVSWGTLRRAWPVLLIIYSALVRPHQKFMSRSGLPSWRETGSLRRVSGRGLRRWFSWAGTSLLEGEAEGLFSLEKKGLRGILSMLTNI